MGKAIAIAFAAAGADVAVNYLDAEAAAQQVVNSIEASGGRAIAIKADVSSETEVQAVSAHRRARHDSIPRVLHRLRKPRGDARYGHRLSSF